MKTLLGACRGNGLALIAVLGLAACQTPVSNAVTVSGNSTLPLGSGSGVTVYAADTSGYGLLVYASSATNWTTVDWSNYYSASNPYSTSSNATVVYPAVNDVTTDSSGTVYAATTDGLLIGQGSSCVRVLHGSTYGALNGVTVTSAGVYVSTTKGLWYSASPSMSSSWTEVYSGGPVFQWTAVGLYGVACTSLGLYESTTPTTGSYSAVTGLNSNSPNTAWLSGSTLYVGTPVGVSKGSFSGSWTDDTMAGTGVNGVLGTTINSTSTFLLATTSGILYSQNQTINSSTTWGSIVSGVGVNNIVVGANTSIYYYSNGVGGLGILQIDSSGNATTTSVLTSYDIAKVYVTSA